MKQLLVLLIAMPLIAWANTEEAPAAWADPDLVVETAEVAPPPPPPAPKKAAAPYTLPFHLRPIGAVNVIRLDNVLGFYDVTDSTVKGGTGNSLKGMKEVSILNAGYRFAKDFGILARIGVANNFPDKEAPTPALAAAGTKPKNGYALTNGLLFVAYTPTFLGGDLRTAFYLGVTAPIGSGGGGYGDADARGVNASSGLIRSNMDGALFLVNDVSVIPGIDIAYVKYGLTVQLEATYLEIMRARAGEQGTPGYQPEVTKRNFVSGLFVGYSIIPQLSAGVELRYQRWLKPPHGIRNVRDSDHAAYNKEVGDLQIHNMTVALGVRGNFKIGEKTFFRPALSYAMGVMGQIADQKYHLIQLDLPFVL
jgi:hypothetical protein